MDGIFQIFNCISLNENAWISNKDLLKHVPEGLITDKNIGWNSGLGLKWQKTLSEPTIIMTLI